MKQRSILAILWLSICLSVSAQTQQGFVKTLGRPNQKGVALSGVTVRVKGGHNAVLSNAQGTFAMPMPGKKPGDAYALQQVQKQGYELRDKSAVGRQYAYSDKVPLTLVMASSSQLSSDKQRIENKAYEVAERGYKAKLAQLEQQKDANSITIDQYRQLLQDLQDKFEKYQSLIDGLAEHYALVDYDALDEQEREINICIEKGDLERADSLLQQLGIQQRAETIAQRLKAGQRLIDEARQEQAEVLKRQEKDAEYLYQLYTIALAKFDNDKARFYIETRAELDTTNVEWQMDVAYFDVEYLTDFNKALLYGEKALLSSLALFGEDNSYTIKCYNLMSICYNFLGDYDRALDYGLKAANILEKTTSEYLEEKADCFMALVGVYHSIGGKDEELPNLCKAALLLMISKYGIDVADKNVAECWALLGGSYNWISRYNEALGCFKEALNIMKKCKAFPLAINRMTSLIGATYLALGETKLGLEYQLNALNGLIQACGGDNHYSIALSYRSLSLTYFKQRQFCLALSCAKKSLKIMTLLKGDQHPETKNAMAIVEKIKNKCDESQHQK